MCSTFENDISQPLSLTLFTIKATLLVGGAALLGAIGIVGIASLQGLQKFHEKADKHRMDDCCENLEQVIQRLREEFNDEENEQDRLAHRQQCLCRLVSIVMNFNYWWVIMPNLIEELKQQKIVK